MTNVVKIALLLMVITFGGCTTFHKADEAPTPPLETISVPPIAAEPVVVTPIPAPASEPVSIEAPPANRLASPQPLNVAIIISRDLEKHHQLSDEIGRLITFNKGTFTPFHLYQQGVAEVILQIKNEQYQQVVAIGLDAAKAAKMLQQIPVVFCQIYNYQDYNLVSAHFKGVSLIPAIDQQFKAWKETMPALKRVGVIVGDGKQAFIEEATQRASARGITLISRTVNNDKAMWEAFRRLLPQVEGFWLLPDNRILSRRTLRNMADYSIKHTTPLFTVNGLLLEAGAMLSATQVDSDIAEKVVARLLASTPDNTIPGADITPLELAHITRNADTIKQFNFMIQKENTAIDRER